MPVGYALLTTPSMVSEHWLTTRTANITINVGIGHEMTAGRRRGRLCLSGGMSKPRASVYLRSTASLSTHDQKYLRDFHQTRPSVTMGRSNVLPRTACNDNYVRRRETPSLGGASAPESSVTRLPTRWENSLVTTRVGWLSPRVAVYL